MVRINLINPEYLADQHLVAEYNEILKFFGYLRKYPDTSKVPDDYCLGKGHILFFKNKLKYLEKRFGKIRKEMIKRGFAPRKTLDISGFDRKLHNDWRPCKEDYKLIKKRLVKKIEEKPGFYKYCGKKASKSFLINLIKRA